MQAKICTKCNIEKDLSEFAPRKNRPCGYESSCKICCAIAGKQWRVANKGYGRKYYLANKDVYIYDPAKAKAYYAANKKTRVAYQVNYNDKRRKEDPQVRVLENLRRRLNGALSGNRKGKRTLELLGCSLEFLRGYLEARFQEGMTWQNYGEWHIDHIIPCSSFNMLDPYQQEKCFHYKNLQPLWATDNLKKGKKQPPPII